MNKQKYLKMMKTANLNKTQANIAGPLIGAFLGLASGNALAGTAHREPGFLTRLLYMLPLLFAGIYFGNRLQNHFTGTDQKPFSDSWNIKGWLDNIFQNGKQLFTPKEKTQASGVTPVDPNKSPKQNLVQPISSGVSAKLEESPVTSANTSTTVPTVPTVPTVEELVKKSSLYKLSRGGTRKAVRVKDGGGGGVKTVSGSRKDNPANFERPGFRRDERIDVSGAFNGRGVVRGQSGVVRGQSGVVRGGTVRTTPQPPATTGQRRAQSVPATTQPQTYNGNPLTQEVTPEGEIVWVQRGPNNLEIRTSFDPRTRKRPIRTPYIPENRFGIQGSGVPPTGDQEQNSRTFRGVPGTTYTHDRTGRPRTQYPKTVPLDGYEPVAHTMQPLGLDD